VNDLECETEIAGIRIRRYYRIDKNQVVVTFNGHTQSAAIDGDHCVIAGALLNKMVRASRMTIIDGDWSV
jgi:hypothetical protein